MYLGDAMDSRESSWGRQTLTQIKTKDDRQWILIIQSIWYFFDLSIDVE